MGDWVNLICLFFINFNRNSLFNFNVRSLRFIILEFLIAVKRENIKRIIKKKDTRCSKKNRPNQITQKKGIPPPIFDFFSAMWDNTPIKGHPLKYLSP